MAITTSTSTVATDWSNDCAVRALSKIIESDLIAMGYNPKIHFDMVRVDIFQEYNINRHAYLLKYVATYNCPSGIRRVDYTTAVSPS